MIDLHQDDSFPVGALRTAPPGAASPETSRPLGVLVVDDQEGVRLVLNSWLRREGFAVWLAAGGREALDLYRRYRGDIDVVVLDVCMPGLDGPQTMAALRELNPQVRCCFLSGGFGRYTEGQLREGGAAVLTKPPRLGDVTEVVRLLAGRASELLGKGQ